VTRRSVSLSKKKKTATAAAGDKIIKLYFYRV